MDTDSNQDNQNVGWRLRTLRQRHNLTLVEVARGAGLDVSYLSRLERDALQNAKPKPDTVSRVLDAMGASLSEREAVYHIERPPITREEIAAQVKEVASEVEDSPEAFLLGDEYWYLHYYNRAARALLGLSPEEYSATVGQHMLGIIIDPSQPRYSRVPDDEREQAFKSRARMFKRNFAGEEFDSWYERVVGRIREIPWAAAIWDDPEAEPPTSTIGRDDTTILNPLAGKLRFRFQMNALLANPRFFLASWTPLDAEAEKALQTLPALPEFAYTVVPVAPQALPAEAATYTES